MCQLSIRSLMAFVLGCAVVIAAVKNPYELLVVTGALAGAGDVLALWFYGSTAQKRIPKAPATRRDTSESTACDRANDAPH